MILQFYIFLRRREREQISDNQRDIKIYFSNHAFSLVFVYKTSWKFSPIDTETVTTRTRDCRNIKARHARFKMFYVQFGINKKK